MRFVAFAAAAFALGVLSVRIPMCSARADVLPGDSLYQLRIPLVAQDGRAISLDVDRGHPVVISMLYTSCPAVCPLLVAGVQGYEQRLDPAARARLRVLMVSFDPERDTPSRLAQFAQAHHVDLTRWTFAHAAFGDVRKLAALLDIKYRRLPDGDYNHATVITLLDGTGRVLARTEKLASDEAFFERLRTATSIP